MKPANPRSAAKARRTAAAPPQHSVEKLLHELQVHQIELEMQNEALREAQAALEKSRDRYLDLYEFAPVGYVTLTASGLITEINLTGAKLLGEERRNLLQSPFARFVAAEDGDRWYRLFRSAPQKHDQKSCQLAMQRSGGSGGSRFHARLDCVGSSMVSEASQLRITLTDITEQVCAENALQRSADSFRRLAQISPAGIFRADASGACNYGNPRGCEITGRSLDELLGDGWLCCIHPEHRAPALLARAAVLAGQNTATLEVRILRPDGSVRWGLADVVTEHDENGQTLGFIIVLSDTSEMKQRVQRQLADERLLRNTLIREVHHRIKNNLQSVAALLRRELGGALGGSVGSDLKFKQRLETAITQVSAVAVVHGLQGADPGEAIRLCDTVRHICQTVEGQLQRPVHFCIADEQTTFSPVQLDKDEAVAVALILNELVFNSVKHSPPDTTNPVVTLHADGRKAQVLIRNALAGDGHFDLKTGVGINTGLHLVRSLLPLDGAHLSYEKERAEESERRSDGENHLLTRLRLSAPTIKPIPAKAAEGAT